MLHLDDHVFDLGQAGGGILKLTPFGAPDPQLGLVTVAELLAHTGGWDRVLSGDPMFESVAIANALGIRSPPGPSDIARYMMGRPLDHAPGSTYAYSNFGYMLLGLVIEQVTGGDYLDFIHRTVFTPLEVADSEVQLGRTLLADRSPREPWYSDPNIGPNVFSPGQNVLLPDGGFCLEAMEAHGGLITSARAYARFLGAYWIDGSPRAGKGQDWTFFGSLPGTWTLARQRPDGVDLVAFFNQRTDSSGLGYDDIQLLLDGAAGAITSWPSQDVTQLVPSRPVLLLNLAARSLAFPTETGRIYQAQTTPDLRTWTNLGLPIAGSATPALLALDPSGNAPPPPRFFRLLVE